MLARVFERFIRWLRPPGLVPRLSAEGALALARARAASDGHDPDKLQMVSHRELNGKIRWHVSEAAVGGVLLVEVDDESGAIDFIGRMPGR